MKGSADVIPDGFISLEWELPVCGGWYELLATVFRGGNLVREIVTGYYDAERECFAPIPGALYVTHFREVMPDAVDLEEFRKREEMGAIWI